MTAHTSYVNAAGTVFIGHIENGVANNENGIVGGFFKP
jgi:hypothetical protein